MKKKIISILILVLIVGTFVASQLITYAAVDTPHLYVNLSATNSDGIGYGNGDPKNQGEYIWNIITQDSKTGPVSQKQRNLYCVKADYGQTWYATQQDAEKTILDYNLSYDMQADREVLLDSLQNNENDENADDVVRSLLTPGGGQYEQLLWILDHSYIEGQTDKDSYLESVGIYKDEYKDENGNIVTEYYNSEEDYLGSTALTSEDILAVQKMVIWYFTNGQGTGADAAKYDKTDENVTNWLFITKDSGNTYTPLSNEDADESRNKQANYLYRYLINQAKEQTKPENTKYTDTNNYKMDSAPANVNTTGLTQKDGKYVIKTNRNGSNYLIGPIVIEENNDLGYDINITVKDVNNNTELKHGTNYIYTDANGTELKNIKTQKDLVGIAGGFYISVPRSTIQEIDISVKISYNTTSKKLWLQGTEDDTGITLNGEQPLVEITQNPQDITVELTSKPEEFDLALRKYITALHDKDGVEKQISNARNLNNISLDSLDEGTTATYNHRKDPVVVEEDDIVTYQIRIYNEGNKAGYATKIIDQLPDGLIRDNTITTVVSKDKNGNEKNTYTLEKSTSLTTSNQIVLTIVDTDESPAQSLNAYTNGNLDYETIEINCKVTQKPDTKEQIVLTNVAWIDIAYNSEDAKEITTAEREDRDSEPATKPNVNKDNMQEYRGSTSTEKELTDNEYFYKGQQDDDDFEKLVIMPVEKNFDLELVKFIAAISKDAKIDEGEYLTDTKNSDGIYERAPKISIVKEQDSEDRRLHCDWTPSNKIPVLVEEGDYVLYTIRVYNAGELDGYAAEIKDHLPTGLEFVETTDETAEYYGIWKIDSVENNGNVKQVLSTDYLAKGKGKETDAQKGDADYTANLLKALNPDAEVTDGENRNPDYRDVQVLCKVVESAQNDSVLVNYAQISKDTDKDGNDIEDDDSMPDNLPADGPHEDDEDFESIKLQCFDLSLRKFITSINGKAPTASREPVVDVSNLKNGTGTTAVYNHPKTPIAVQVGDKVIYTIRVYNEGDINGFASEVKDYLPQYLTYVKDSEINTQYGWQISEDGRIATTTYLANTELQGFNGTELDYADLKIECLVSENAPLKEKQTNIAEISEYTYNGSTVDKDIDSTSDNIENKIPSDENLPSYKDEEINKSYVPGNEDDDDFEKVYIKEFDLALRKFITKIQETDVTTRIPQVKIENGVISYEHPKDPITVHVDDKVIYTLRIYNEGEIDGYASEITDDIPEYLEYLPEDSTNAQYMWKMYNENGEETENVEEAVKVKTTYLAKENGEDNLIKAFDGTTLSYKEIQIAFKVKDPNSNTHIITNYAQISDDTDEDGNEVKDKDSEPDQWNEGEDDQDIENVKVEYFDLSILKFVSKVIVVDNGTEKITETGYNGHEDPEPVVKVELHKKKLNNVVVKFGYGITVTNEGDIPGYATELTDYVPEGLKFEATDNPNWTDEGNGVISTKQLENKLLQPGESQTVEVIFTWINGSENLALKTNIVEISDDKNEFDVPDRDSTPDNKQDGEDDIDLAKVILTITTGAAKTYFTLTLGLLAVVAIGVILIKKFVI